ncbi:MSMEG_4193 family putative phosphomutase [Actinomadura sp. KC06]|uniref:histidine phosphatase family protein n=1 Tax=Actinomadura sp. KC06 TaxID=2530369 RepID=UPI0010465AB3|nr:histidine phosphatase family protein [Actinomadura sp. KC06]TDD35405.1 MSMEG_4193 family putative phosphomutase [Actinomadura sp. KC06]
MTTLLLVRHGLTAMTGPVLAGWTPAVHLDERGRAQVAALARRMAPLPLAALVSSPLERCAETAEAIAAARGPGRGAPVEKIETDERFGEVRYGDWTGRPLKELAEEPLWKVVQAHPSAVTFPGEAGESLAAAQHRAVTAVRDWNARIAAEHGPDALYAVCSHGDIIKAIVADALGLHLDQFQRIQADPASLTVIRYTETRPFVVRVNDTGGDIAALVPETSGESAGKDGLGPDDAVPGGGA